MREYQDTKIRRGLADYDDLLVLWLEVLEKNKDAAQYYQERFSHILVDEYQDVNSTQIELINLLNPKNIFGCIARVQGGATPNPCKQADKEIKPKL